VSSIEVGLPAVVGLVLMPAVVFAMVYPSLVHRLSRALVSPYTKADVRRRLSAAFIDALVAATLAVLSTTTSMPAYLVLSAGYVLLRDAIGGQSVGKLLVGLIAIDLHSGRPASTLESVKRNSILLLPGANIVAIFLEGRTILIDPQGQRLGDRLAQTQVVEGAGARDLVRSLQDWLLHLGDTLGRAPGRRRTQPGQRDRAA
jgi:uncharacterized RDD family membrane protein YckC